MFPDFALRIIRAIDKFTGACIYPVMLLVIPLVLANVIEVVMRYIFEQPTAWAADTTVMAYGSLFMLFEKAPTCVPTCSGTSFPTAPRA
jgi:TRAP-type mannitol/chloroaromatic compound transport system permease small subunit